MAQVQPLVPELHGGLQGLRIQRPPLSATNTASIPQSRCATCAVTGQPLVSTAEADPCFCRQLSQRALVEKVLIDEQKPALLRQTGIGMTMHRCVRSRLGVDTSTGSDLTSHYLVTNLLKRTAKALTDNWLDILRRDTLELVPVAGLSDVCGMLPKGQLELQF